MFTGSAFAVAADGNQLLGDPPNFIPDASIGETDCAQKIFGAEGGDFEVAVAQPLNRGFLHCGSFSAT